MTQRGKYDGTGAYSRTRPRSFIVYTISRNSVVRYVGATVRNLDARWIEHKKATSKNTALAHAIRKYGAEAFVIEHIASALNETDLMELERILIDQHNTVSPHGYNLKTGGLQNFIISDETRGRMTVSHTGKKMRPESTAKRLETMKGWKPPPQSPESIARSAASRTGIKIPFSEKRRLANLALSVARKGKPGHPSSPATNAKISASHKGKRLGAIASLETRRRMVETRTGKKTGPRSELSRANMSRSARNRKRRIDHEAQTDIFSLLPAPSAPAPSVTVSPSTDVML